jgi:N-acetylglutamate synthase-like GNAT family acetyltransferase
MIRKASTDDIPAIVALVSAHLGTLLPRTYEDYIELLPLTWVATDGGRVVGSCVLEVYSSKIAEIRSFVVDKEYRSQGFGKGLIEAAVAEARSRHIHEIMVVTSSPQYFEKLNFGACLGEKYALFWNGQKKVES